MAKDRPHTSDGGSDELKTHRWSRFDAVLRLLTLIAFAAFAVAASWNLRLIQEQLDRLEEAGQRTAEHDFWRLSRTGTNSRVRTEAFLRLVARGNTQWRGAVLKEMDLDGAALKGAALSDARFESCTFNNADLKNVQMSGGGFETCKMNETNLTNATLDRAIFLRSTIKGGILHGAKLVGSSFEQSTFNNVEFFGADMKECNLLLATFLGCNLSGVNLSSANLSGTKFLDTDLRLARVPNALFQHTDFTGSNWWRLRGLPKDLIEEYRRRFEPSKTSRFRQDYEKWLTKNGI